MDRWMEGSLSESSGTNRISHRLVSNHSLFLFPTFDRKIKLDSTSISVIIQNSTPPHFRGHTIAIRVQKDLFSCAIFGSPKLGRYGKEPHVDHKNEKKQGDAPTTDSQDITIPLIVVVV